jgi:hypothetical protein
MVAPTFHWQPSQAAITFVQSLKIGLQQHLMKLAGLLLPLIDQAAEKQTLAAARPPS